MSEYIVKVEGQIPDAIYERELTEIVRCRDCKHFDCYTGSCARRDYVAPMAVTANSFCSWGERE